MDIYKAPWSPPMVVVSRHGNSYRLRWGGSGTLLERLVPVFRLKVAPKGTNVDGVYEIDQIIDHRPAAVGPEARDIEYRSGQVDWVRPRRFYMGVRRIASARCHRCHQRLLVGESTGDNNQHTIWPTAKERSARGQDTSSHRPPL